MDLLVFLIGHLETLIILAENFFGNLDPGEGLLVHAGIATGAMLLLIDKKP